jgi:hypothetical protein
MKKLKSWLREEWRDCGYSAGYEVQLRTSRRWLWPLWRVLAAWYMVASLWHLLLGVTVCRVAGHKMIVEEGGDAESGPCYDWHCGRCGGESGHRGYGM